MADSPLCLTDGTHPLAAPFIDDSPELSRHTTLRVGGPARRFLIGATHDDLVAAASEADDAGTPLLVLGGGSNIVAHDDGFDGTVVRVATRGVVVEDDGDHVRVTAAAGEPWDALVAHATASGWVGLEALSGIPGLVGSTPVQNVGAYGTDVSATIVAVRCWDRTERRAVELGVAECGFGYRHSRFKAEPGRFVVLEVTFRLPRGEESAPVRYADLAAHLGIEQGQSAPLARVRDAVLAVRRSKGMVLDDADHDTWSAGSFFTNPVLSQVQADALPANAPRFPQPDGTVKSSAAWLIAHSGFDKGHGGPRIALSSRHVLAITNRGGGTAAEVRALAAEVRDGVQATHGVRLVPEPVVLGADI